MKKKPKLEIDKYENKKWYLNGLLHRKDGSAIIWKDGSKFWYLNGKRHRIDGPAIEYKSGNKEWYLNDEKVKAEDVIDFNPDITEREYLEFVISL